jgi:AGZA family xanthine/uracil permease-like MFS transporter
MPLTSSIADGMGLGFIAYAALKLASGGVRACPPAVLAIALLFGARFVLL